jgi:hypothetical protein
LSFWGRFTALKNPWKKPCCCSKTKTEPIRNGYCIGRSWLGEQFRRNTPYDNYVLNTFLAWEPRSRESRRNAIGSRFMKMRLPEKVY